MQKIFLFGFLLLSLFFCKAQEEVIIELRYIDDRYNETLNESFVNRNMIFIAENDTLNINLKLPFNINNPMLFNTGIFYNCHLQQDSVYTITLKKICVNDIPEICNSYYKINAIFDDKDCSKFTEIQKNTPYEYICGYSKGYGKFVDIDNVLYEITDLIPHDCCFFPP
jgi:hypothetical protein